MAEKKFTLTGNDLALAEAAAMHAISWWKSRKPQSRFARKEIANYEALVQKLSALNQHAYPYEPTPVGFADDYGDEVLMVSDPAAIRETRAAARRANRSK